MKTVRKHLESLVLLFTFSLLFQSCVLYEKSAVSLEWAATQNRRAKVKTTDNQFYKFKNIRYENEQYYGIKREKGETIKTPLVPVNLKSIYLENRGASTFGTILTVMATAVGVLVIWYIIDTGGGNWIDLN